MSHYRETAPPPRLQTHVHCVWLYTANGAEPVHLIVPDGRPEFIVHLGEPYRELGSDTRQPQVLFAGQLTQPLKLTSDRAAAMVGVRFRPDGARAFLGRPMSEATDRRLDLTRLHGSRVDALLDQVAAATSDEAVTLALSAYVQTQIGDETPDPLVGRAVDALSERSGEVEHSGISLRQFQRRFKREIGVSPRMFRAIRRFRAVFNRLWSEEHESWVERAIATGYFDQAQMARDFQRFLGCSAREWIAQSRGLGKALGATPL